MKFKLTNELAAIREYARGPFGRPVREASDDTVWAATNQVAEILGVSALSVIESIAQYATAPDSVVWDGIYGGIWDERKEIYENLRDSVKKAVLRAAVRNGVVNRCYDTPRYGLMYQYTGAARFRLFGVDWAIEAKGKAHNGYRCESFTVFTCNGKQVSNFFVG